MTLGNRTLLAATCVACGHLKQGTEFDRYKRKPTERAYIDRRCRKCRFGNLESIRARS